MSLRTRAPFVLLPLLLACLAAPAAAQGPARPGVWFAQAMTRDPVGAPSVTYFWSKGRSLRALTVIAGRPILTMVHRDWYYVVDELVGVGVALGRSKRALAEDASGERPFAQEALLIRQQGAELVGTRDVGGTKVKVFRLTDDQARREVWTPVDDVSIPLQVEVFDRSAGSERTVQYLGWQQDLDVPDRFFRPDARITLERMSYEEYLQRTAEGPLPLPVLYGGLLHGVGRQDE